MTNHPDRAVNLSREQQGAADQEVRRLRLFVELWTVIRRHVPDAPANTAFKDEIITVLERFNVRLRP